jgi:CheY-like chemotaxis protein
MNNKNLDRERDFFIGRKILLTEDKKINQLIVLGLLAESGFEIDIANNGEEAVNKCKECNYSLILMDIEMPIMDGYDATRIIRKINKEIPIIALTSNGTIEDINRTKSVGMNEHLLKPIDLDLLYHTFSKYINVA